MLLKRVLLLVLSLELFGLVASCGIGVHIQILSRIRENLAPDVNSHSSFAIPGAFFPDAFYSCMSQSTSAEIAHWPPFLKSAAQYYRKKYDAGKDPAGIGLRAFLFGVLTHQIADVSWHSLGVDQGLLMAMAIREYDGDYAAAHNTLDTGGDIIIMERLLRTSPNLEWLIQRWSIPSKDIIEIYSSMGISISRPVLEYCMARGVAALGAELNIARSMYPSYAKKSPLLLDRLEDYFLGGLQEITSSIIKCLDNFESWLDNGTPDDPWELCPVYSGRAPKRPHYRPNKSSYVSVGEALKSYIDDIMPNLITTVSPDGFTTYIDFPNVDLPEKTIADSSERHQAQSVMQQGNPITLMTRITGSLFGSSFAIANFRGEAVGPCIAIGAPFETTEETGGSDGAVYVIPLSDLGSIFMSSTGHAEIDLGASDYRLVLPRLDGVYSAGLASNNFTLPHQFGASTAALNLLNTTLLAVTSPGISRIDIFSGPSHLLTLLPPSEGVTTEYGAKGRKLFGHSLYVHDIDRDGYPDLIVSAANSDLSSSTKQQGEIVILSGREIEMAIVQGSSSVAMDLVRLSRLIRPMNDQSIHSSPDFELFGSSIAFSVPAEERNTWSKEITYIGAAGSGAVYAFDAVSGEPLFALFANLATKRSSSGFGGGVLLTGRIKGLGEWVLIGSPNESLVHWKLKARDAVSDENTDNDINQQRRTDTSQTGVCYLYLVRSRKGTTMVAPKLIAYLVADEDGTQFGKFGYAGTKLNLVSSDTSAKQKQSNTVFISSPFAQNGMGALWRIDIDDIISPMLNIDRSDALNIDGYIDEQAAVPVIRLKSILQGSPINKQTESWFGKSIAAVGMDTVGRGNVRTGYLFVGMPLLGFGDLGTDTYTGSQLMGGVGVYPLSY
ncbi:zinc dependent phospholipase C-domain-containing protein [Lipomyces kononenkoae]